MDFLRFTPAMNAMYPFCTNSRERAVFRFRRRKHGNETIQSNQMARFWKLFVLLILIPGLYIIFKFTAGFLEAKVESIEPSLPSLLQMDLDTVMMALSTYVNQQEVLASKQLQDTIASQAKQTADISSSTSDTSFSISDQLSISFQSAIDEGVSQVNMITKFVSKDLLDSFKSRTCVLAEVGNSVDSLRYRPTPL